MHLKDEIIKDTNRVEIMQTQLQRLESSRCLQDLLGREKDVIRTQQAARMLELEKKLAEYREKYGVFPGDEKAVREVLLPKKSGENEKISQTVRTILETKATPAEMVPDIMELAMEGKYSCEEASREVVADACEMMLGNSTVVEQLAKENRSLAEKIRDWLREWVENLKTALEGLQADRTESRAMMQYARELQELWDDALMDAARNNRGAARETAEGRTQYKTRGKYWRPDLKGSEWRLLERQMAQEIGSRENFLDEATKWVYADEKGVQVFALYGVGDGRDATPLYAVGGKQAVSAAADMRKFENGGYRYDGNTETALSWIRSVSRSQGNSRGNIREASRGGETGANDGLHGLTRVGNAGKPAERGPEDQRGVKEKFSMRRDLSRVLSSRKYNFKIII